jgi:RND family efflux transporter MFP subunit
VRYLRLLLVLCAVAAAAAGAYWWWFGRPVPVATVQPTRGDAAELVYANGVVEPRYWAKVTPLVRERIVGRCDCEGAEVTRGAVLGRLDTREAEATLAELEARRRLALAERDRVAALVGRNIAAAKDLDRTRSDLAQIEALIVGQKARLENYVLRAPMDGTVLREDGEVGEIAEPGEALFWVGRPIPRVVIADVNEEDIPRVAVGQRALLRSDAFVDRSLESVVDNITPKGDPVAKTYRVRLMLPDDTPLMIGMSVDVNIVVRVSADALLVPSVALDGDRLFVVEGGVAERRAVRPGIRGTEATEILSGLDPGARVISPYPETLADGARVETTAAAAGRAE